MKIQQPSSGPASPSSAAPKGKGSLTLKQQIILWAFNSFLVFVIVRAQSIIEDTRMPDNIRVVRVFDESRRNVSVYTYTEAAPVTVTIDWESPVNCTILATGNTDEIRRARHKSILARTKGYTEFTEMVTNCSKLIEDHEYVMSSLSKEEEAFPIAFAIRMHKHIFQFEQLLRAIYRPQNVYCIHIDLKSPKFVHKAIQNLVKCFPNVFIASKLQYYVYESISPVWADLQCMTDLLNTQVQWKYFLNLPGQEFPLRTNLQMVRILKYLNGTNDVETFPLPELFDHRIKYKHEILDDQVFLTRDIKPGFQWDIKLRKGNAYNSFSRAFVEWLLVNKIANDLYNWANDTASPDELVWATLNALPDAPGGYNATLIQPNNQLVSRFIDWAFSSTQCRLRHYVHEICIFSSTDYQGLLTRNEMFANKFDSNYDSVVIDCLEEEIKHRRRRPLPEKSIDWKWMKNLPHMRARQSLETTTSNAL